VHIGWRSCTFALQAVCFLRPTRENVIMLKRELRQPRFQSYHFCKSAAAGQVCCVNCILWPTCLLLRWLTLKSSLYVCNQVCVAQLAAAVKDLLY
jgi:hypothetical protein